MNKSISDDRHKYFMSLAVKLSQENLQSGNGGPFGAVIVKDGELIASEANSITASNDPTAHAEINAIRSACKKLNTPSLEGCVIYTSCEPCPMCASAIYWAKMETVYYANTKADAEWAGFGDELVSSEIIKLPENRSIAFQHMESADAIEAFKEWVRIYGAEVSVTLPAAKKQ
ncbi:MAG: nucleoside deaminase [Sphingobacteriaceae bacterium]